MKAFLMHRDRDFERRPELPWNESALTQDLELDTLLRAMAGDDEFIFDVSRDAILWGMLNDMDTILYRQAALKDCLANAAVIRELYDLAIEVIEGRRKHWWGLSSDYPGSMLHSSVDLMGFLVGMLTKLRHIIEIHDAQFKSEAFTALFAMLRRELSDEYLANVRHHLKKLRFDRGILVSVQLGDGNEGAGYTLRNARKLNWLRQIFGDGSPAYSFRIHERDEAGGRILSAMHSHGISRVAVAMARSVAHVESFFEMLRMELAFYVGCLNLHERLVSKGEPMCFPRPLEAGTRRQGFAGLYDPCLSLLLERRAVGNATDADGKSLVIITGANQGGKSIFLRSIGLAQMMMQCGMFVAAESFDAELCTSLFTHYKREEDATMKYGKLDEELARMNDIADHLAPDAMLLCNESFAATNQREGSEIARQIVCALLEKRIKVFFVTHLYEFAHGLFDTKREDAIFLRAERQADGSRTFKLLEGEPLVTSYGEDLYREVFSIETEN